MNRIPSLDLQVPGCHHLSIARVLSEGNAADPLVAVVLDTFADITSIAALVEADVRLHVVVVAGLGHFLRRGVFCVVGLQPRQQLQVRGKTRYLSAPGETERVAVELARTVDALAMHTVAAAACGRNIVVDSLWPPLVGQHTKGGSSAHAGLGHPAWDEA